MSFTLTRYASVVGLDRMADSLPLNQAVGFHTKETEKGEKRRGSVSNHLCSGSLQSVKWSVTFLLYCTAVPPCSLLLNEVCTVNHRGNGKEEGSCCWKERREGNREARIVRGSLSL